MALATTFAKPAAGATVISGPPVNVADVVSYGTANLVIPEGGASVNEYQIQFLMKSQGGPNYILWRYNSSVTRDADLAAYEALVTTDV